ncbi:MAG: VWA domain-containing protein [Anaerolineales bacterium]
MEARIVKFISALRLSGVRVSLAESADAFQAVDKMGVKNRDAFRLSMRATLIKESTDFPIFEELFSLYFGTNALPTSMDLSQDLTPEEAEMLARALRQFTEHLREMLGKLVRGEQFSREELDQLGKMVGLNKTDDLHYRNWMTRRMEQAMRFPEVRKALRELSELMEQMGMNKERLQSLQKSLLDNMHALEQQLHQFAGQRIAENMAHQPPDQGLESLFDRSFNALTDKDMQKLRNEVSRLAARLRTRISLRQKKAKSGQLDAKATLRANLKHGNVPFQIKHRDRTLKPKLVVICDISTSMRYCSELMLSLIYALQDQISKTHAFVYIDHLEYVSPDFMGKEAHDAVKHILHRMPPGHYNTNLGYSLKGLVRDYLDSVDNRTTFIVVGDGRNNYNDPRIDLFNKIARRSRQVIWINPETPMFWGQGDSDMHRYAPSCDMTLHVSNLSELTKAVDQLLTH